jgi:hypothetical protein
MVRKLILLAAGLAVGLAPVVGCSNSKEAEPTVITKTETPRQLPKDKPGR